MMSAKKVTEKTIPECVIQSLYGGAEYTGDKPWMQFDTWDVKLACKLITLNYPVDLEGSGWDGAKKWPLDKWGRCSLTWVMRIFDRALSIAKSSIHAGKIKEHDTPANWIKWAQEKGYDVAHLMPAMAQEQIELSLADAVEINNAAKLLGCTVKALFEQAENDERLLYVALKPHSSKLAAIPSHPSPQQSSRTRSYTVIVPLLSRYAASLAVSGSADIAQYQASFGGVHDWHYWTLDMPQTVNVDMVFVPRSQLFGAPAAVEQVTPSKSKARGGRPRTIGKKANAVHQIIEFFEQTAAIKFTSNDLPGSAADLLAACQRMERAITQKCEVFGASEDAFNTWLKSAGYGFSNGRTPDAQKEYWTKLCVQTVALITPEVFTEVYDKATP